MELTKTRCKQTELGWIPEDWTVFILDYVLNGIADIDHYMPQTRKTGIPYIMTGNLKELVSNIDFDNCKKVSISDYKKLSRKVKNLKGDVILARYATIGTVSYVDINSDFLVSYSCVTIKPNTTKVLGMFLFYYFKSSVFEIEVRNKVNTNTQGNVGIGDLNKMKIALPSLQEQKAIAQALSDIDTLIQSLEALIAKKKLMKQGAMQQLLTGKTRLKGFEGSGRYKQMEVGLIPEEWEIKSYGEVFQFLPTATFSRAQLYPESDVQCLHYGDIHTKFDYFINFSEININGCSEAQGKKYALLENGDLIMADASEDYLGIGKSVEVKGLNTMTISGLHTILMRDKSDTFVNGFKGYLHSIPVVKASFERLATGLKVYGVTKTNLRTVQIPIPPKKEQKAIAQILSDMDAEITQLEDKKVKYEQVKQGMMQELLAGKTRLV